MLPTFTVFWMSRNSDALNGSWKLSTGPKCYWNTIKCNGPFSLRRSIFRKQKAKFFNFFFDLKLKNKFQKILSFFDVGYDIEKTKKKSKFVLFLNQKTNYTFGTRIQLQQEFFLILVIGIIYGTTVILFWCKIG